MRRKDREKEEAFALQVLEHCEYATMATVDSKGMPYCVPLSPVLVGKTIYFHGALAGKKLENIKEHPQVCVSAVGHTKRVPEEFTTEFESAIVFGRCQVVEEEEEKTMALMAICEKYAKSHLHQAKEAIERSISRTAVIKVEIQSITGKAKVCPPKG